jgi:hypothetical protein
VVSRTTRKERSACWCMRHVGTAGDVVTKMQCSCINSVSALKLSGVVHKHDSSKLHLGTAINSQVSINVSGSRKKRQ